jgi:hypothetical protein
MAENTGRTVSKFFNLVIADSGGTLRDIPVSTFSALGVVFDEETSVIALQDAIKSALPGMPDAPLSWTGPFDTSAAQAASGTGAVPALSGSHTVLEPLNGAYIPKTIDAQLGIQQTWETGEPQFGVTADTTSNPMVGYIITSYVVNIGDMTYACEARLWPGSTAPDWGTAAETT